MEIPEGLAWCCTVVEKKVWAVKMFLNVAFCSHQVSFSSDYSLISLLFMPRFFWTMTDCPAQRCCGPLIVLPDWGLILIRAIVNESHSASAAAPCEVDASQSQSHWGDARKKENKDSRMIVGGIGALHLGRKPPLSGCCVRWISLTWFFCKITCQPLGSHTMQLSDVHICQKNPSANTTAFRQKH